MERPERYYANLIIGAALGCLMAGCLSLCLGNVFIGPGEVLRVLTGGETQYGSILRYARLPRTLACLLAGAGLSTAGAVLQNVLANKLASPGIIGVNAGAGLGVTVCCALGMLSGWAVSAGAFLGSLLAVGMIVPLSRRSGVSKATVILSGAAMNSMLGAFSESITVLDPDVALLSMEFRVGGFSAVSYTRLIPGAILICGTLVVLLTLCNELDVVSLGDETARSVGLNVAKYRLVFLILAALLAGSAVSFAGLLGFVGLIVPHFVRRFTGNESRRLLPVTALTGAGFVTLCDLAARLLFQPYELPVGILMALLGGPAFVILLLKRRGGDGND